MKTTSTDNNKQRRNWMDNKCVLIGMYVMGITIMALQLRSIL